MEISFQTVDSISRVAINGVDIPNVKDYKIITSASGDTEVIIKIVISGGIKELDFCGTE